MSAGNAKMLGILLSGKAEIKGAGLFRKAILLGDEPVVDALIKGGLNLEERDIEGLTPLLFAVKNGFPKAVELLLNAKADLDAVDNEGNTARHLMVDDAAINPLAFLTRGARSGLFDKQALRLVFKLADVMPAVQRLSVNHG